MLFIKLAETVAERYGHLDTTPMLAVKKHVYRDNMVVIEKRINPPEIEVETRDGHKILFLRGINVLHYDESPRIYDHLVRLCPELLLDVMAENHEAT
jgi:hypothetical protein